MYDRGNPFILFVFLALIPLKNPTLADRAIQLTGRTASALALGSLLYSFTRKDFENSQNLVNVITANIIRWSIVIYLIVIVLAAIRYLGENQSISGFGAQTRSVFSKLLLYMLLPAIVITGSIFACAYFMHFGPFNSNL